MIVSSRRRKLTSKAMKAKISESLRNVPSAAWVSALQEGVLDVEVQKVDDVSFYLRIKEEENNVPRYFLVKVSEKL